MQATNYETYEDLYEQADLGCQSMRAPKMRDMTSKQKFNTGARYRRRPSGASGSHRRRQRHGCL